MERKQISVFEITALMAPIPSSAVNPPPPTPPPKLCQRLPAASLVTPPAAAYTPTPSLYSFILSVCVCG